MRRKPWCGDTLNVTEDKVSSQWLITQTVESQNTNLARLIVAFSKALRRFAPPFYATIM
jgi:hypothetical protein